MSATKRENKVKALLISMPWADYQFPSFQVGSLVAYAKSKGFDVDGRHLHLETALILGPHKYDRFFWDCRNIGECVFSALLFRQCNNKIVRYLKRYLGFPGAQINAVERVVKQLYDRIKWDKYDLVGFSVCYEQLFSSLLFAKWIKRDYPAIKIVFGGAHATEKLGIDLLQNFRFVDWCVDGEGELPLISLLGCLSKEFVDIENHVPGLIYRDKSVIRICKRQQLRSLDDLPDPNFDSYFVHLKKLEHAAQPGITPCIPIEASRGCYMKCAFCWIHANYDGYMMRSPENVSSQIKRISERYRVCRFRFIDSTIPTKKRHKLFSLLRDHNRDYRMMCDIRAETTKDDLKLMRSSGVNEVQVGIEALSTRLLKKMNKGTRFIDNLQVMKFCEEIGIENMCNIMLGFPTESQNDIDESVKNMDYACSFRPPADLTYFVLDWGSPVYNDQSRYSICDAGSAMSRTLLPGDISKKMLLMQQRYRLLGKPIEYTAFYKRFDKWVINYKECLADNCKLLSYLDLGSFLEIEDRRWQRFVSLKRRNILSIVLAGVGRELYLFCDSIRCFDEIKKRFPKWDEKKIKKVLNKLVKLKVMFREDDDYLSLAIRANGLR